MQAHLFFAQRFKCAESRRGNGVRSWGLEFIGFPEWPDCGQVAQGHGPRKPAVHEHRRNNQVGRAWVMNLLPAMESSIPIPPPSRGECRLAFGGFVLCLLFNFWGVHVGWESKNLPGGEFR